MDSDDEALCEMLGLKALGDLHCDDEYVSGTHVTTKPDFSSFLCLPRLNLEQIQETLEISKTRCDLDRDSICIFPDELSISPLLMRRITDDLTWDHKTRPSYPSDKTYEPIRKTRNGFVETYQHLTRLENFVNTHPIWNELCHEYLAKCVSALMGEEMVLFKEKLNLKPSHGTGFAPHLDTPSLRVPFGISGPQNFVTVMVAIDDMTIENGCLRVVKGRWSEECHCEVMEGRMDGNPDAEGRAGAIPSKISDIQVYEDVPLKGGSIAVFNGWTPHRSASNTTNYPRRAIFLTYNPLLEGDFHDYYYIRMRQIRNDYRSRCTGS
jgi:hypothetical protein